MAKLQETLTFRGSEYRLIHIDESAMAQAKELDYSDMMSLTMLPDLEYVNGGESDSPAIQWVNRMLLHGMVNAWVNASGAHRIRLTDKGREMRARMRAFRNL
jgi:hypothetical protein